MSSVAASPSNSGAPPGQISLDQLSLEQLAQVAKQLDDELKHLANAFARLKQAQSKFQSCIDALDAVKPANKDKRILVPLTSSLYVPGKMKDVDTVLVDIGTGYYVEKTTKAARTLYNGKILALRSNLSTLGEQIEKKQDNARAVQEVLRIKNIKAQQEQSREGDA